MHAAECTMDVQHRSTRPGCYPRTCGALAVALAFVLRLDIQIVIRRPYNTQLKGDVAKRRSNSGVGATGNCMGSRSAVVCGRSLPSDIYALVVHKRGLVQSSFMPPFTIMTLIVDCHK